MEIKVVKYDEKRWTVEMSAYGFTYHLVPTESEEEAIINRDAIESFLTPCDGKESSEEMGDCNMPRVSGSASKNPLDYLGSSKSDAFKSRHYR